jgi:transcriptional regulator with XRE-family HTH domain
MSVDSTTPNGMIGVAGLTMLYLLPTTAYGPGSGGTQNIGYLGNGIPIPPYYASLSSEGSVVDISTAAENVDYIKTALKISTSELAKYLGVSRQAIYNWKNGGHRKIDNVSKLENLQAAADVLVAAQVSAPSLILNRKLPGGKTVREVIAAGGDGREAAQSLVYMLRREDEQRKAMLASVAGRKPIRPNEIAGGMSAFRE